MNVQVASYKVWEQTCDQDKWRTWAQEDGWSLSRKWLEGIPCVQLSCGRSCVSRAAQSRRWECPAGQDCTMERLSRIMQWKTQQKMSATLSLRPAHHLYTRLMQDCLLRSRPS